MPLLSSSFDRTASPANGPASLRLTEPRRRSLAELYESNFAAVFRLCARLLKSQDDAADAAHEVFLIAADSMKPGVSRQMARAWLLTVARNHCLDLLRRRKRLSRALTTLAGDPGARDFETDVADRDLVDAVFKQLSVRERQALWQSAVEHRPLSDIAVGLQLSYMAAAQVLHRARRHALLLAARAAAVLGLAWLGRARHPAWATADRLLAAAVVPLIVVSIQSSSSSVQTTPAGSPPAAVHRVVGPGPAIQRAGAPAQPALPSVNQLQKTLIGGPLPIDPGAVSPLTDAVRALRHTVQQLSGTVSGPVLPTPGLP